MKPYYLAALLLFCTAFLAGCKQQALVRSTEPEASLTSDPGRVQLLTSDIDLFWRMYDNERPLFTRQEIEEQYIRPGSAALALYYRKKIEPGNEMLSLLNSWIDRIYYEDIRETTLSIHDHRPSIIEALHALKRHYPPAVFPRHIVFVMGALNAGGVVLPNGQVVIAAEMFSKTREADTAYFPEWLQGTLRSPSDLPVIVLHEMIHVQQRRQALHGTASGGRQSLLERALLEGSAEFITKLILGTFLNKPLLHYGDSREEKIWNEFRSVMHGSDYSRWLYNGGSSADRPADLGYYVGFKIAEHYYRQALNKKEAVREIIEMKNAPSFLEKSGYGRHFRQP